MKLALIDDDGNVHILQDHLTGDSDDAYLEMVNPAFPPGDDEATSWFDPQDIIRDIRNISIQIAERKKRVAT